MGEMETTFECGSENRKGRGHVGNLDVDGDDINVGLEEVRYEGIQWLRLALNPRFKVLTARDVIFDVT
jgi:hypothetical protein